MNLHAVKKIKISQVRIIHIETAKTFFISLLFSLYTLKGLALIYGK